MVDAELEARLARARAELRSTMANARASLEAARRTLPPTPEEKQEFERAALRGDMGGDMQQLARRVELGHTTWEAVFEGASPYAELLRGHLTAMGVRYAESVRQSLEDDPTFDPTETSPGV